MIRTAALLCLVLASVGCKKDDAAAPAGKPAGAPAATPVPVTAGTVGSDGIRRIDIKANADGYQPDQIGGKPNEKLDLVFTRTDDTECVSQVKTPDGKLVDLPKGKPVEVAVVVPATGKLGFACGMDMYHGYVVAQP